MLSSGQEQGQALEQGAVGPGWCWPLVPVPPSQEAAAAGATLQMPRAIGQEPLVCSAPLQARATVLPGCAMSLV